MTGLHDMGRGYKNFLPPGPGANTQAVLAQQRLIHKGTELRRLPMEWWNGTNSMAGSLLNRLRRGQLNVTRANAFLKITRDGILVPAYHDQPFLTRIYPAKKRF